MLAGWWLGLEALTSFPSGTAATMKPNTAACFVLAGVSLWITGAGPVSPRPASAATALAVAVGALGALTLFEYLTAADLGIDSLLIRATGHDVRMAIHSALNLVLTGASLFYVARGSDQSLTAARRLAMPVAFFAFASLLGYVFAGRAVVGLASSIIIAPHTSVTFLVLTSGILLVSPRDPETSIFYRSTIGALTARRLFPLIVVLPVVLGYARLVGENIALYETEVGVALMVLASVVLLAVVVRQMAGSLDRADVRRARAEADLRSERQFRQLLDSAPDAMVIVDVNGGIRLVNSQTERLFGHSRDELIGKPVETLIPERYHDRHPGLRSAYFHEPRVRSMGAGLELYARRKDGSEIPVEVRLGPLETGEGILTSASIRDVTEKRAVEQMRADFVAMLTHDLKNPLTAIAGFASLFETRATEEHGQLVAAIERAAGRALAIANNFLDYTRIATGSLELHLESVALNDLVREVVESHYAAARNRGIALDTDLADDLPPRMLDGALFGRAVTNLVSNALKFSPQGGRVVIRTRRDADRVRLTVEDQGPGIAPEERERLFHRFGLTSKPRRDSTGLGLFIVKSIVDAHGGEVAVDCPPTGGSVFGISLPAATVGREA